MANSKLFAKTSSKLIPPLPLPSLLTPPLSPVKTPPILKVHHGKVTKKSKLVTPVRVLEPRVRVEAEVGGGGAGDNNGLGGYGTGMGLVPGSELSVYCVCRVRQQVYR